MQIQKWKVTALVIILLTAGGLAIMNTSDKLNSIPIDFKNLSRPSSPNYYLSCPKDFCNIAADQTAPVFKMNISQLRQAWEAVISQQARTQKLTENSILMHYQYVQRIFLAGFPDYITVQLIAIDENNSTLALLSFSKYGYSDLGMNKKRVNKLLTLLKRKAESLK